MFLRPLGLLVLRKALRSRGHSSHTRPPPLWYLLDYQSCFLSYAGKHGANIEVENDEEEKVRTIVYRWEFSISLLESVKGTNGPFLTKKKFLYDSWFISLEGLRSRQFWVQKSCHNFENKVLSIRGDASVKYKSGEIPTNIFITGPIKIF